MTGGVHRRVLHVLPHPGGGGETYVDTLASMPGYRFGRIFLASRRRGPSLVSLAARAVRTNGALLGPDIVHVHGEVAALACLPGLVLGPSVVTLHGLSLLRRLSGARADAAALGLRLVVRSATRTICVSEAERRQVIGVLGPRHADRVVTIKNGIAILPRPSAAERGAARAELGIPAGAFVVASVAELEPVKDPLTVARAAIAAGLTQPVALLFAGDGSLRGELERVAAADRAGSVRVLGFRSDVSRILAASDAFVLASSREGLPYALLEAMSLAVPAVVSDAAGCVEAVGDAGVVVRRGDVQGFADAFRGLAADQQRRERLGARGRERVSRLFRSDVMVEGTRRLYDAVIGGTGDSGARSPAARSGSLRGSRRSRGDA